MVRKANREENVHKGLAVPYVSLLLRVLHRIRQSRIQKFALMAKRHHRAHGAAANTLSHFLLRRTRFEPSADFAFAASKRTAKT